MNHGAAGKEGGKGQLRPAPKSDNIAGSRCCCLLPSLVYSSMLVTLETAVGAYRGILLLCSHGQRCPVVCGEREILRGAGWFAG